LVEVHKVVLEGGVGIDLCVANFGWLGLLLPQTALIRVCAPHVGVKVNVYPTLGLPPSFGSYDRLVQDDDKYELQHQLDADGEEAYDDELMLDDDDVDDEYEDDEHSDFSDEEEELRSSYHQVVAAQSKTADDPWAAFSGENVGWRWDEDTTWHSDRGWNPIEPPKDESITVQSHSKKSHKRSL